VTTFTTQVAIVGAGIQGCAAARELALRGVDVLVLDSEYAGRHASGVNAGGVRTLGRHIAELPLALASKRLWTRIGELVDDDCGYRQSGQLKIATSAGTFEALRVRSDRIAESGLPHVERLLTPLEVRDLVPAFVGPITGAAYVVDDGSALPFRTTQAFRRKAESLGARFVEGASVHSASRVGGEWRLLTKNGHEIHANQVINCAGAWAASVGSMFGDKLPIQPNGSMQIVTTRLAPFLSPVVSVFGQALSIKQFDNGTVVIGGGHRSPVDLCTARAELTLSGLAQAARQASKFFPILMQATIARCWSGIEGFTPDGLPLIGVGSAPSVVHAAGFSAHGFQLGPAVGVVLADLVTTGNASIQISGLDPRRFRELSSESS
jgi:sarcosine oxidase subunit beta